MSGSPQLVRVPSASASVETIVGFALEFNAYALIADDPNELERLVSPVYELVERRGTVPFWVGLDFARGMLFYAARRDHWGGGGGPYEPMRALVRHIRAISGGSVPRLSDGTVSASDGDGEVPRTRLIASYIAGLARRFAEMDAEKAELFEALGIDRPAKVNRKTLREELWYVWHSQTRVGRGKYSPYLPWSPGAIAARAADKKAPLTIEHLMPFTIMCEQLEAMADGDTVDVERLLMGIQLVVLSRAEDTAVTQAGYRERLPEGSTDPWDRYRAVGMDPASFKAPATLSDREFVTGPPIEVDPVAAKTSGAGGRYAIDAITGWHTTEDGKLLHRNTLIAQLRAAGYRGSVSTSVPALRTLHALTLASANSEADASAQRPRWWGG